MKLIALIFTLITLNYNAFCNVTDTLKLKQLKFISELWGLFAFNTKLDNIESISYIKLLSCELERFDTNSIDKSNTIRFSFEQIYNFGMKHKNEKIIDDNVIQKYHLIYPDLLDFINNNCITDIEKTTLLNIIKFTKSDETMSELTPKYYNSNDENISSVFNNYKIQSKYDALAIFIYYWNVGNYFSPYPINTRNKDSIFYTYAFQFLNCDNNILQNYRVIMAYQKDSHIIPSIYYPSVLSSYIKLNIINNHAYIYSISSEFGNRYELMKDDEILKVNNDSISRRIPYFKQFLQSSN